MRVTVIDNPNFEGVNILTETGEFEFILREDWELQGCE